ncbi:MAG: hypothetical protein RQ715_11375 [Methylococcales bacterium]|nr:hypothetical protein [Methylococcales bacterium]
MALSAEQAIHPVIRKKDFLDLFNTDADLSGFDTDISPFIRDQGTPQLRVFWRDIEKPRADQPQPLHDELCPVSMGQIKDYFKKNKARAAFVWDGLAKTWKKVDQPFPGMTLLLPAQHGGYDLESGFDPAQKQAVPVALVETGKKLKTGVRDQETEATRTVKAFIDSECDRFAVYRDVLIQIRSLLTKHNCQEAPKAEAKDLILQIFRNTFPDAFLSWLDAVLLIGTDKTFFPLRSIFGH